MKKSKNVIKNVIKTLDLKPKKNTESHLEEMTGKNHFKKLWEGRFGQLCSGIKQGLSKKVKKK
jgi:hypothetical protein